MPHSLGCCQQRHHHSHKFYLLLVHYTHSFHIYNLSDLLLCNDRDDYILYKIYFPFFSGNPLANHLTNFFHGQQIVLTIFLIILGLLNIIEEVITIFCFPFTTIFYIPFAGLNLPVEWYFIPHREGRYTPD